jgi:hypothetical protein
VAAFKTNETHNWRYLTEKHSKSVVGSPSDPARPFDVFAFFHKKNILWNSKMTVDLKARSGPRHVTDHAPRSGTVCQYDSSGLPGLRPFGSSLF